MRRGSVLALALWAGTPLRGGEGTASAPFLSMSSGARGAAMGDAQVAAGDDAAALFRNPAALTQVPTLSLTAFHAPGPEGTSIGAAAYAHNLGRTGVAALGLRYASAGASPRTDDLGNQAGSVTPRDQALSAGYAYRFHDRRRLRFLNGWSWGASAKQVSSRVSDSARAVTADAGVLSRGYFRHRLWWGAAATNLFGGLDYGGGSEPLPREFRWGAAWRASRAWRLSADMVAPRGGDGHAALGAEYGRDVGRKLKSFLRVGYSTRGVDGKDGLAGLSAGLGLTTRLWSVDYVARFEGNGWMTQGLSLSWGFGVRAGAAPHVRYILDDARRLAAQNRFAEAVLKYHEALVEEPGLPEAKEGLEEAARNLR